MAITGTEEEMTKQVKANNSFFNVARQIVGDVRPKPLERLRMLKEVILLPRAEELFGTLFLVSNKNISHDI